MRKRSARSIGAFALIVAIAPVLGAGAATANPAHSRPWNCQAYVLDGETSSLAGCRGGPPGGEFRAVAHCSHLSPAGSSKWKTLNNGAYDAAVASCPWGTVVEAIYETR
ncbi:hypothetical protein GCM10022247_46960 [Allokutzneria multivorans]|uniref:Secreted protein n=1 Tax=Allokutzneria multivorans TaxID=1142134 RepID=A0ABP7SY79_9PSEU